MKRQSRKTAIIVSLAMVLGLLIIPGQVFADGKGVMDLVAEAKAKITEVTPQEIKKEIDGGKDLVLLDVRSQEEYDAGHIGGAVHIPRGLLEFKIGRMISDQNANLVLYCRTGARSAFATARLQEMGYKNARNMAGAFKAWTDAGYSIYNRHGELIVKDFEKPEE